LVYYILSHYFYNRIVIKKVHVQLKLSQLIGITQKIRMTSIIDFQANLAAVPYNARKSLEELLAQKPSSG